MPWSAFQLAIGFFHVLVNCEEMLFNLFEHGSIGIDHATVAVNSTGVLGTSSTSPMAIVVFDPAFLILVTATEITGHDPH